MSQVEDAEMVLQLVPIWATCLIYAVLVSQSSSFFTKQGRTMDRRIGSGFQIPPATLQTFICFSILTAIPIYDRVFVRSTRAILGLVNFIISGFLISVIEKATTRDNGESWFSINLNQAHLDYFYWLLAGLSAIELGVYLCFAKSYIYKNKRDVISM